MCYVHLEEEVNGVLELRLAEVEQVSIGYKHQHHRQRFQVNDYLGCEPEHDDVENVAKDAKESDHWDGDPVHQHHHQLLHRRRECKDNKKLSGKELEKLF